MVRRAYDQGTSNDGADTQSPPNVIFTSDLEMTSSRVGEVFRLLGEAERTEDLQLVENAGRQFRLLLGEIKRSVGVSGSFARRALDTSKVGYLCCWG